MSRATRIGVGLLAAVVAVAGTVGGLWAYGSRLPARHSATVRRVIPAAPPAVYRLVASPELATTWRTGVTAVTTLEPVDGRPRWREEGWDTLVFEAVEVDAPHHIVTRVVDHPDFGGTWTWDFAPHPEGTEVTVTEDGIVYHPLFRVAMHHVFGETATMEAALDDLEQHLER